MDFQIFVRVYGLNQGIRDQILRDTEKSESLKSFNERLYSLLMGTRTVVMKTGELVRIAGHNEERG